MFANVSVAGDEAVSGNLAVTGTTVLTGNTTVTGTLTVTGATTLNGGLLGGSSANIAINTNKFTVAASSGNTLIAGTLAVTGAVTLSSTLAAGVTTITGSLTTSTYAIQSVGNALSGAGTTRADATVIAKQINNFTTVASGTGAVLPAGVAGTKILVFNAGANVLQVYGNGSDTIDGVAGSTGVPLTNTKRAAFICVAANTIISAQLGIVSG